MAAGARTFSGPKVYDPSLAERPMPMRQTHHTAAVTEAQKRRDMGFDEDDDQPQDKHKETADQIRVLRAEVAELQAAVESAKDGESLASRKLQSFQQVNRSQNTLMRAELQKSRRRLAHAQAVANKLQKQNEWLQANSPVLNLPPELQGLPREDKDGDEDADLAQQHQRWENDVAQLYAMIQAEMGLGAEGAPPGQTRADSEESRQRIAELEASTERQAKEVEQLRQELRARPQAGGSIPPMPSATNGEDSGALRQELEGVQKEHKEQQKKLKQLAQAYKQLDQSKKDLEARLATADKTLEATRAEAAARPHKPAVSPAAVARIRSMLTNEKAQIAELKASVAADFQQQLPALLNEALQQKMPLLQKMVAAGSEEWKQKFLIESDRRRKLHNLVQELKGNIRVYCRVRPLNERERTESSSCISFPDSDEVRITNESLGTKKSWQFNEVFNETSTQAGVFDSVRDLVVSMLDGYNVCIFAYGQTGSGKTHTMQGYGSDVGVYQRTFDELFKVAEERKASNIELKGSILEIYNEEIRDLIADQSEKKSKLQVKMGKEGIHVPGLTQHPVFNTQDVENLLEQGQRNRSVASTDMNHHSSRSHLLVQIYGYGTSSSGKQISSCITLVDLAGSERLAKSGVTGDRAKEAISINKSLSALGDVINSRATKSSHTPFRNSTLTHLLQDSLSGDSKTLMILQINPCTEYVEETMCSLQFGARVNAVEMSGGSKK